LSVLGMGDLTGSDPISRLVEQVLHDIGTTYPSGPIRRWSGNLTEPDVASRAVAGQNDYPTVTLLPLAWMLASERHRPATDVGTASDLHNRMNDETRIGIRSVIDPEVVVWSDSDRSIRQVVADLVRRSVDQHLRIAWSRLSREPWKDVSVIASDGSDWVFIKPLGAGRASSRIGQAIRWLTQLGLLSEEGITPDGRDLLSHRLEVLEQIGEGTG
jgi:hypothetical protein